MSYDYSKLKGRIIEKFGSRGDFAKAIPISEKTLSSKLTGKTSWSQKQMMRVCEILAIPQYEIPAYFFATKV